MERLNADSQLVANPSAKRGLEDMVLLFNYLDALNATRNVSFDLSLARGLDYYTGMIFEVITSASAAPPPPSTVITTHTASKKKKPADPEDDISESVGVGSICGGGRYDDLVGRFAGESKQIPCVGMSVGIERVFAILKAKNYSENGRGSETQVYVMAVGDISVEKRFGIMKELWDAGVKVRLSLRSKANDKAEFQYRTKPAHISKQFKLAEKSGAPVGIMLGEEELASGTVRIKQLGLGEQNKGDLIERERMVEVVVDLLRKLET